LVIAFLFLWPEILSAQEASRIHFGPEGTSISELASRAVATHPTVLAARERVTVAEGLRRQAGFRPNPQLEIGVSTTRAFESQGEGERSVGLAQTFELGGKRKRRVEVADAGVEAARAEAADTERRIRGEIAAACIEAVSTHRELVLLDQQLVATKEFLRLTEARAREGEIPPLEASLTRVELARMEAQESLTKARFGRQLAELERLIPEDMLPVMLQDRITSGELLVSDTDLRDRALTERPDLLASRLRAQLANAHVRLASALAKPDLIGSVRYARDVQAFEDVPVPGSVFRDRDNVLAFGISIPLPFLDRNQGNIQAAVATEQASRHDTLAVTAEVVRDVAAAYASYRAAAKSHDILRRDGVEASQKNLGVIREAYRLGQLRLLDVLNEQRRTFDLELTFVQAERELALAGAALETAVGRSLGLVP
jgi:cobalt-zinc-cadmium efflux system outer membrane protein